MTAPATPRDPFTDEDAGKALDAYHGRVPKWDAESVAIMHAALLAGTERLRAQGTWNEAAEWQPMDTAPIDKDVLFEWHPKGGNNPHAIAAVVGRLSSYEPGKWWNSQTCFYQDASHLHGWMPLPAVRRALKRPEAP